MSAAKPEPVDELEALRAQLAAARAPREQTQASKEREAEIARLKQELADEPAIAAAVETHGAIGQAIGVLHTPSGVVIVKKPRQASWRRFSDSGAIKGSDVHTLLQACLVHPTKADLDRILDAHPAAVETLGGIITGLAAAGTKEAAEK